MSHDQLTEKLNQESNQSNKLFGDNQSGHVDPDPETPDQETADLKNEENTDLESPDSDSGTHWVTIGANKKMNRVRNNTTFTNPFLSFAHVFFAFMLFAVLATLFSVVEWCNSYAPYLRCDLLPSLTKRNVFVQWWSVIFMILLFLQMFVNVLTIHHKEKKRFSMWARAITGLLGLAILGCCLCLLICMCMDTTSTKDGKPINNNMTYMIVSVAISTSFQIILIVLQCVEICCWLRK
jgi:hypothetical protein